MSTRARAAPTFDSIWRRAAARTVAHPRAPPAIRLLAARLLRRALPLGGMTPDAIVALACRGQQGVALVGGPAIRADPDAVLAAIDDSALVTPAVMYLRAKAVDDEARSQALYQAIVLDKAASDPNRLLAALLVVWHVSGRLRLDHQRAVLTRCLALAGQAVDPYDPHPITFAARAAGAGLLQSSTMLDDILLERVRRREADASDLVTMLAAALQRRPRNRPAALAQALAALSVDRTDALGIAALADARASAVDPVANTPRRRSTARTWTTLGTARSALTAAAPQLAAVTAGPMVAGAAWLLSATLPSRPSITVSATEAFAALALLVAVHVVAAELAADRLRGIVARYTSTPKPLLAGESMAVVLLCVTGSRLPHDDRTRRWIAAALVAGLVLALLGALYRLVARTDPVAAVRAFSRARRGAARRAGRELGKIHRDAVAAKAGIAALGWPGQF